MPRVSREVILIAVLALTIANRGSGDVVSLGAVRDNSIFSESDNSNGGGSELSVGRNNSGNLRRSLLEFDVAASVPIGATVNSVTLALWLEAPSQSDTLPRIVSLHSLLGDWGEGTANAGGGSGSGSGAPPSTGDATWLHQHYATDTWGAAGGDFAAQASSSTSIDIAPGSYDWLSTSLLVQDVQQWLDQPAGNFGWLLRGDESTVATLRRFASRDPQMASHEPRLTIDFTPRMPGDATGDGCVSGADFTVWADHFGQGPGITVNEGDFNTDGFVTGADFTIWADNFGIGCDPQTAVPEPTSLVLVLSLALIARFKGVSCASAARGRLAG